MRLKQALMNANVSTADEYPRAPAFQPRRTLVGSQPNELDRRRIVRMLVSRKRYRYVSPTVTAVTDGYLIESPCCSRRIDPEGGIIDVAMLRFVADVPQPWCLLRKDHERRVWELHGTYERLQELLAVLNADPDRVFWQ